ncbi:endonuclease domain-containing protein, partial [Microbacterium caowuchunii]
GTDCSSPGTIGAQLCTDRRGARYERPVRQNHERMQRAPLPSHLPPSFTVTDARAVGVSPSRLRAQDLDAPYWGTRTREELDGMERVRLLLSAVPEHAFLCGPTAALAWRLPLPRTKAALALTEPVIGVPLPANRIRRPGIRGRALPVEPEEIVVCDGMRCTSPERTWVDLAHILDLPSLVAVADRMLARRDPLVTRDELEAAHRRAGRARGAVARAECLELAADGSESPRESELRVLLILAGLPAPELNVEIFHGHRFVARVDMLYRRQRLIVEYDGDHHRDPHQWSLDQVRRADLESLGFRVTIVTARDFDDPGRLVARIRRLLAA